MECTKCKNKLDLKYFSYKKNNLFYLHCDKCREKLQLENNKKKDKDMYNLIKETKKIECNCGKTYVAFRDYHIIRHQNSKKHLKYIDKNSKCL